MSENTVPTLRSFLRSIRAEHQATSAEEQVGFDRALVALARAAGISPGELVGVAPPPVPTSHYRLAQDLQRFRERIELDAGEPCETFSLNMALLLSDLARWLGFGPDVHDAILGAAAARHVWEWERAHVEAGSASGNAVDERALEIVATL